MKKLKQHKVFSIYQLTQKEIDKAAKENCLVSEIEIYLPDESPAELFSPEWEADNLQECIDFLADK